MTDADPLEGALYRRDQKDPDILHIVGDADISIYPPNAALRRNAWFVVAGCDTCKEGSTILGYGFTKVAAIESLQETVLQLAGALRVLKSQL